MNELLMQVLTPESKLTNEGLFILSAMRGPDYKNRDWEKNAVLKDKYVAPIRLWVLGSVLYNRGGYVPGLENVTPLDSEAAVMRLLTDLKVYWAAMCSTDGGLIPEDFNHHWFDHVRVAYQSIAMLQGWKEAATAAEYYEFYYHTTRPSFDDEAPVTA